MGWSNAHGWRVVLVDDILETLNVVPWWDHLHGDTRIRTMRSYGGSFYNDYDWVKTLNHHNRSNRKHDNRCYKVLVPHVRATEIFFLVAKKINFSAAYHLSRSEGQFIICHLEKNVFIFSKESIIAKCFNVTLPPSRHLGSEWPNLFLLVQLNNYIFLIISSDKRTNLKLQGHVITSIIHNMIEHVETSYDFTVLNPY